MRRTPRLHRIRRNASRACCASLLLAATAAGPVRAQSTCDLTIALDEPGPIDVMAYGIDYSGAGGTVMGSGLTAVCTNMATPTGVGLFENTFYDDDASQILSNFVADEGGVTGPTPLTSCVFAFDGPFPCPDATAFVVRRHAFPPLFGIDLDEIFPGLEPPALTISLSPRTPVCGDGFAEAAEECDDGNTADGDCCSASCTLDPPATPCPDADVCTSNQTCDGAGQCVVGSRLDCDDGLFCTHDWCDPTAGCVNVAEPTTHDGGCRILHRSRTVIRDPATNDDADTLVVRGRGSGLAGDPTVDTTYALCVWDTVGGVPSLAAQIEIPPGLPWTTGSNAQTFVYRDATGANDGVEKMKINPRGKYQILNFLLRAKGPNVPLPGPVDTSQYVAQDPVVTVEIENSNGECWSVEYHANVKGSRHRPTGFRARR